MTEAVSAKDGDFDILRLKLALEATTALRTAKSATEAAPFPHLTGGDTNDAKVDVIVQRGVIEKLAEPLLGLDPDKIRTGPSASLHSVQPANQIGHETQKPGATFPVDHEQPPSLVYPPWIQPPRKTVKTPSGVFNFHDGSSLRVELERATLTPIQKVLKNRAQRLLLATEEEKESIRNNIEAFKSMETQVKYLMDRIEAFDRGTTPPRGAPVEKLESQGWRKLESSLRPSSSAQVSPPSHSPSGSLARRTPQSA